MLSDIYWSILPTAQQQVMQQIAAYLQYCWRNGVSEGPAVDAARDGLPLRIDNGVAVIPVMGPMIRRAGRVAREIFGIVGTDSIRLAIQAAMVDKEVDSVLLRIDSPGGSVSGLDQLADTIREADKPIHAIVEGTAASAAYYTASQADRITVGRGDLVGSIGTRIMLYDFSKAFEEMGVEPVPIDTGQFKSAGAMGTEITQAQRDDFQRIVNFYYEDFVQTVAVGRNIPEGAVKEAGDGRMFTPDQARQLGLIDRVGTLQTELAELRRPAGRSVDAAKARLRMTR